MFHAHGLNYRAPRQPIALMEPRKKLMRSF